MPNYRNNLEQVLALTKVKSDVFKNSERLFVPTGSRGVFGGTIVAQALWAAIKTVPDVFIPHSLHSSFILGGDVSKPIYYHVDRLRDGNSFISREVRAYQDSTLIFHEIVSFYNTKPKRKPATDLTHSEPPPKIDRSLFDEPYEAYKKTKNKSAILAPQDPKYLQDYFDRYSKGSLDYKFTNDFFEVKEDKEPHETDVNFIIKVRKPVVDPKFQFVALAYYSDSLLLITGMKFHKRKMHAAIMSVSLDHSIHFHKEKFDVNEDHLFRITHPRSGSSRKLMYGQIFDEKEIVATIVQEGFVVVDDSKTSKL